MNNVTADKTPDWLTARGGELRRAFDGNAWVVLLNGSPQYRLVVVPAGGKFACAITQTNNGKRLDKGDIHADADAALIGGLNELRTTLGWG